MQKKRIRTKFKKSFLRDVSRLDQKRSSALKKRLSLFRDDPFHPILNNHPLKGDLNGCLSINISGDLRAMYQVLLDSKTEWLVEFIRLGTHSQLY